MEVREDERMSLRLIGALFIIAGCAVCGAVASNNQRKGIACIEQLISALDMLVCELEYHRTPLPELCRSIGANRTGELGRFFTALAEEMDSQIKPNVTACVAATLSSTTDLPREVQHLLHQLGDSLGKFDVEGEVLSLQALRTNAVQKLETMRLARKEKGKTNQTLWICAGVAAAVLMM